MDKGDHVKNIKTVSVLMLAASLISCGDNQKPEPRHAEKFGAYVNVPNNARQTYALLNPLMTSQPLAAETYPRGQMASSTGIMIGGTGYYVAVPLFAGQVVTNITICIVVAGVAVTLSKVGLYTTAGVRLALSADQGASWETTGYKAIAMITPYVVPTTGVYFASMIAAAGTLPTPGRMASAVPAVVGLGIGPGPMLFGSETGQTDLDPTATITTSATSIYYWAGVN